MYTTKKIREREITHTPKTINFPPIALLDPESMRILEPALQSWRAPLVALHEDKHQFCYEKAKKSVMGTSVISELRPARSGNSVYVTPHSAVNDPSRVPRRTIWRLNIIIGRMDRVCIKKHGLGRE